MTLLRNLARAGAPVSPATLATETGQAEQEAAAFIDRLPGVYRDDDGSVVAFWGLAVTEFPPHEYRVGGQDLFTWCAWDPFILTDWLGGSAEVSSVDSHTGGRVSFRIENGSVRDLSHPGLVLSFKLVDEWSADVIASFCHFIHYFTDQDSARAWTDRHPDTFVLSLSDAIELGRIFGPAGVPGSPPHAVTHRRCDGRPDHPADPADHRTARRPGRWRQGLLRRLTRSSRLDEQAQPRLTRQ